MAPSVSNVTQGCCVSLFDGKIQPQFAFRNVEAGLERVVGEQSLVLVMWPPGSGFNTSMERSLVLLAEPVEGVQGK